jgi:Sec-independent protein secretion pathway component TatC
MGIITSQALSIVVSTPFALFAQSDATEDPTTSSIFMSSMGSILGYTVMLPFIAAFTTLLYTDLRIRKENIATELDKAKNQ